MAKKWEFETGHHVYASQGFPHGTKQLSDFDKWNDIHIVSFITSAVGERVIAHLKDGDDELLVSSFIKEGVNYIAYIAIPEGQHASEAFRSMAQQLFTRELN